MKINICISILTTLIPILANSQSLPSDMGARSKGLGNSSTTLDDAWSIFNNIGGISGVEHGVAFFGFDKYGAVEGFDKIAAGVIHPFSFGNVGISVYRFGDESFNEQITSAAFGNRMGFVSLGFKISYYQMSIDEFGTAGCAYFDLGGIVDLIPKLSFGAYISNFTASKLNNAEHSKLPVTMKVGLAYTPVKEFRWNVDLVKDVDYDPALKTGIEYLIIEKFALRTGLNTGPFKSFFGIGLYLKRFQVDYAVGTDQLLGTSHQLSVSYHYQKGDEK